MLDPDFKNLRSTFVVIGDHVQFDFASFIRLDTGCLYLLSYQVFTYFSKIHDFIDLNLLAGNLPGCIFNQAKV